MKLLPKTTGALALFLAALVLNGCSCGFDCSSDDDETGPSLLTLGFSDALPEDLKEVVLEVDSIVLERFSEDDVPINSFSIEGQDPNQPNFQIDLLSYRGGRAVACGRRSGT